MKQILVVEDNDLNFELMEILLEPEGFTLRRAPTGQGALELLADFVPDLVILDLGLPDMDGVDVLSWIRGSSELGGVPVMCVSGHALHEDRHRALAMGANSYVTKPIDTRAFAVEVEALLEGRAAGGESNAG